MSGLGPICVILLTNLFSAQSVAANSEIYKPAISFVEARMLVPNTDDASKSYPNLQLAETAMVSKGAKRALFSFSVELTGEYCSRSDIGLYLGVINDQDKVFFNTELIGITADPDHVKFRKTSKPRLYLIPQKSIRCGEKNNIAIDAQSLIGRRIGPFGDEIAIGPWWELEIKMDRLQEYLLFFREIGILILSVTIVLLVLFSKYSQNELQMAFVSFSFWAGLMCISLSGWFFTVIGQPEFLYSFHAALVCVMMVAFIRVLSLYVSSSLFPKLSHWQNGPISLLGFGLLFIPLTSGTMVQIYKFILLGFMSVMLYILIRGDTIKSFKERTLQWFFLILIIFGVASDTARIWGIHSGPNISAYLIGISVVGLGLRLAADLVEVFKMAANTYRLRQEKEHYEILSNLASQVAHDIRSPLSALDTMLKDVSQLPEEKRTIIRSAVSRIHDIANNLLEKNRQAKSPSSASSDSKSTEICLLSSLIEPAITEKRLQFRSKIGVEIDSRLATSSYGLFAKIQPVEFKRMLSNLVNNAVEALDEKGSVILSLDHENERIIIKVQDTGKGIPPEILAKLGQRGETHGKVGGSGLGLYHARTTVESWGGSLKIESALGKGTTTTLTLPQATPPDWFVSELQLNPGTPVVILDDDTSIHQVWDGRFQSARVKEKGIEIIHFSTPKELRKWVRNNSNIVKNALCLFDYELLGYSETGLSLAEELNLGSQTILVTSRYEEKQILDNCIRLSVRMIPKALAGYVPIKIVDEGSRFTVEDKGSQLKAENKELDSSPSPSLATNPSPLAAAVLIDDDALVHMTWKMAAKHKGITLKAFKKADDFMNTLDQFSKDTPVYLDSELGDGVKGEDIAKTLHENGFTELYMETGHPPEKFAHLIWLKAVRSKEAPWE